ncbi:ADC synthase [Tricharina praecox]|uniref:ADC synthase n=1 Tax=Tricharina praecox TaxID=43433 RepID=UPI002220E0EE|nr:ADC synthase [Tricharina praecox]KAI5854727.1 ADC synthase [Tricharina praecox]
MAAAETPRILLVDAYDSFTHNLAAQLSRYTAAEVHTIHIDSPFASIEGLLPYLPCFDAVVIGPGPGSPDNDKDVGIIKDIWHLGSSHMLPVFGVCLGLQSLCLAFGGNVERLRTVKHGLSSTIRHGGVDLFEGLGNMSAVRYHSLHATLGEGGKDDLEALAWADDAENGEVLMAVKHRTKPFRAVQYHPESICTEGSDRVVENFWRSACRWNMDHGRRTTGLPGSWRVRPREASLLDQLRHAGELPEARAVNTVQTTSLFARGLDVRRICEMLDVESKREFVLLESAATPGRWSIIGILTPGITQLIRYTAGDSYIELSKVGDEKTSRVGLQPPCNASVWRFLASYMERRKASGGKKESPFWGGLVGYFSYELGVESLSIPLPHNRKRRPDVNLAFAERSIVIDSLTGRIYVQSLIPHDGEWLESMKLQLQQEHDLSLTPSATPPPAGIAAPSSIQMHYKEACEPTIVKPSGELYKSLVRECQSYLASGNSYELCLTARTRVNLPSPQPPVWSLYGLLRARNPAPYAAYLRLQGVTLLSSSPERFLSFSRTGAVQLRPIKGTVRKTAGMTRQRAEQLLNTPKERAENLMILDLIRHDLHRILGAGNVTVPLLMSVEEYASVFQLVSVIEGAIPSPSASPTSSSLTGLDILASSLPPGSMTGAPKKRSVEILQALEATDEERGVYSGVLGYLSVCGAGDWNVIIRSAYRYDDEGDAGQWWLGAGGAVTALSTPDGEWEEMETKLESTLRAFCG